jgi:lipopolysaccharide transport system ATP-binding protein
MGHVRVAGLGKAYKLYPTRWSRVREWVTRRPRHQLKWALREVEFSIEAGQSLGIVGLNGSGKSTLLKLIAGLAQPTTGAVEVGGRVAALLELGMGFHNEFTGRQNVVMAGQLMGMPLDEIHELMPEIEAFAEIGPYMDQPFRVYSSGMQMRLAFSVATARRPDILIVDEALSVGDSYFQHKSFGRIREFREKGTTMLVVSHDRFSIQTICDQALLLSEGRQEMFGEPGQVLDYYHALLGAEDRKLIRMEKLDAGRSKTISGNRAAQMLSLHLTLAGSEEEVAAVEMGAEVDLVMRIAVRSPLDHLVVGFMIKDKLGQAMYGVNTHRLGTPLEQLQAGETVTVRWRMRMALGKGSYSISTSLTKEDSHQGGTYEWMDHAGIFHVYNERFPDFIGCSLLEPRITIER